MTIQLDRTSVSRHVGSSQVGSDVGDDVQSSHAGSQRGPGGRARDQRIPAGRHPVGRAWSGSPAALLSTPAARPGPVRVGCAQSHPVEGYRLSQRARLCLTLTVLAVALLFATGALPTSSATETVATQEVSVEPGDTLWTIARAAAPGGDTGAMVDQIRELNGLDQITAANLPTGLILEVPVG